MSKKYILEQLPKNKSQKNGISNVCYNCRHASKRFKIDKLTHYHCLNEKEYKQKDFDNGKITAWDTLRVFSDTCENHELKNSILKIKNEQKHINKIEQQYE